MGAGQIGGIATLLDIDFNNAAGFIGTPADITEAHFIVYYMSHALLFCVGTLIEAHVVLSPAMCIFGEKYKFNVYGGSHSFVAHNGVKRIVTDVALHKEYNHSNRWTGCSTQNVALLVLDRQYSFRKREAGSTFVINRARYGRDRPVEEVYNKFGDCQFFGWGSRRNGYLIPLLIQMYKVNVKILAPEKCDAIWNVDNNMFLCIERPPCRTEKYGALCPDDVGSPLLCKGFIYGMMTSRLVDRPCGVGFLDISRFSKFLTCGVDDAREVMEAAEHTVYDFKPVMMRSTATLRTLPPTTTSKKLDTDPPPPKAAEDDDPVLL